MADLDQLDAMLDRLQAKLPQLMLDYPDEADFWMAFAGEAELIEDRSNEHTYEHVMLRINAILSEMRLAFDAPELEEG